MKHIIHSFHLLLISIVISSCIGCSEKEEKSSSDSINEFRENTIEDLDLVPDQLSFTETTIREVYDSSAQFEEKDQYIIETPVAGRFKINGVFTTKKGKRKYYEIYVQKFDSWEYGTLIISSNTSPSLTNASFVSNGKMKEAEQMMMNKKEDGKIGNINYTVIKRNAPNYVTIYTPKKLTPKEVKVVYDEFRNTYESILLTDDNDPDSYEYIRIDNETVWDFTKGSATKIKDYK